MLRTLGPDKTKISLRSKSYLDVNAIATMLGGGGHVRAAGATMNLPLEQAEAKVLEVLSEALAKEAS